MEGISKDELRALLASSGGDKYIFDENTTFIKEQNVTVQSGGNFFNGTQPKNETKEDKPDTGSVDIIGELKGAFFGKEDCARKFLNEIADVKPTQVIEIVGRYLASNDMSKLSCHRDLWKVLHNNGYYEPSESNWNKAINKL